MMIQFILSFFLIFALSRVINQLRNSKLTIGAFLFWSGVFIFALFSVLDPKVTTYAANFFGIGRGTDFILYLAMALLFYLIFRISISIEEIRRDITELVRKIALDRELQNSESARKIRKQ